MIQQMHVRGINAYSCHPQGTAPTPHPNPPTGDSLDQLHKARLDLTGVDKDVQSYIQSDSFCSGGVFTGRRALTIKSLLALSKSRNTAQGR